MRGKIIPILIVASFLVLVPCNVAAQSTEPSYAWSVTTSGDHVDIYFLGHNMGYALMYFDGVFLENVSNDVEFEKRLYPVVNSTNEGYFMVVLEVYYDNGSLYKTSGIETGQVSSGNGAAMPDIWIPIVLIILITFGVTMFAIKAPGKKFRGQRFNYTN